MQLRSKNKLYVRFLNNQQNIKRFNMQEDNFLEVCMVASPFKKNETKI